MGLFNFLRRLFGGPPSVSKASPSLSDATGEVPAEATRRSRTRRADRSRTPRKVSLRRLDYRPSTVRTPSNLESVRSKPYRFSYRNPLNGSHLDLSRDADERWLEYFGLPSLRTPDDLAEWLDVPIGMLAWLTFRTQNEMRPANEASAHYHFIWKKKRSGRYRLIEAPKSQLKHVQTKILRGILDLVPAHPAAHGFVAHRSILTNAAPHVGSKFILKLDLEDFYPSVKYARVVAIFRSLGLSREVSLWLARLSVSMAPWTLKSPGGRWDIVRYLSPHLPQGAPTSPALANLSAFGLDVRLSGLAKAYRLTYTRYADDLTFSGPGMSIPALNEFIPLTTQIIRDERFSVNRNKRKIIRDSQRQCVTGVVVNEKVNVSRKEFDTLKATLHNCLKFGPESQNRDNHPNFAAHLRGRIAHISQLNPQRAEKLLSIYQQIRF